MFRWRPLPLEDARGLVAFARDLRVLVESASAERAIGSAAEFARAAGMSPASLSTAVSGAGVPTEHAVRRIVSTASSPEDVPAWLRRRAALATPPSELVTVVGAYENWAAARPGALDYRDTARLLSAPQLSAAYQLAVSGAFQDAGGELWAFLVTSAVQHGDRYHAWFSFAPQCDDVLEALVERVISSHRRPRWRAAWLLQHVDDRLLAACAKLATDLAAKSGVLTEELLSLLTAMGSRNVEALLSSMPADSLSADVRQALAAEFRLQAGAPSARGRLREFVVQTAATTQEDARPR